ncbi:retroviral-like aspartic protease family protein [uncultured Aquimarina sp.]|uniref:retroviral-like aspartic protease family protein n=1 Tax=uncultured Aquimarina sp. TaxID=575652 RepID=UPI002607EB95|nr:retroviral-like aspartic protease family protein [uncultured Aquimarina sp.]
MNKIIFLFFTLILASCSSSKIITLATQGELSQKVFNEEIPIYYLGKHIFIEVKINRKVYTFLFDTGYDISTIDKSLIEEITFTPLRKQTTTGSSFEDVKLQYGFLSSLDIGGVEFKNFGIGLQDLSNVKSPFSDGRKIYGIIGTNILRKAFWQIDYQIQIVRFSNIIENFQFTSDAFQINMKPKTSSNWGLNRIKVTVHGLTDNFVFDTGSFGSFSVNYDYMERLKKEQKPLKAKINNDNSEKPKYIIDQLKVDSLELENQELLVEKDIDLLIGNDFFDDYIVTIDWNANKLYLQHIEK